MSTVKQTLKKYGIYYADSNKRILLKTIEAKSLADIRDKYNVNLYNPFDISKRSFVTRWTSSSPYSEYKLTTDDFHKKVLSKFNIKTDIPFQFDEAGLFVHELNNEGEPIEWGWK